MFGPETTRFTEALGFGVANIAQLARRTDGEEEFTFAGNIGIGCGYVEAANAFLCIGAEEEEGSTVNFVFGRLVGGESSGNFEVCPPERSDSECLDALVNTPGGFVFRSISAICTTRTRLHQNPNFQLVSACEIRLTLKPCLRPEPPCWKPWLASNLGVPG